MARSPTTPEPDRYRPFRRAVWAVYGAFTGLGCLLIIVSVVGSVYRMTPPKPPSSAPQLPVAECVVRAQRAFTRLDEQRKNMSQAANVAKADQTWTQFRVEWLESLRRDEAACDVRDRRELRELYDRLEKVESLYTTAAVQYSGEIGPAVDGLQKEFRRLLGT